MPHSGATCQEEERVIFSSLKEVKRHVGQRTHILATSEIEAGHGRAKRRRTIVRVVYLADDGTYMEAKGQATYNPADEEQGLPYDPERGFSIARGRAVAQIARQLYERQTIERLLQQACERMRNGLARPAEVRGILAPLVVGRNGQ